MIWYLLHFIYSIGVLITFAVLAIEDWKSCSGNLECGWVLVVDFVAAIIWPIYWWLLA